MPVLFSSDGLVVRDLTSADAPALQALFDANASYFILNDGQPASPEAALQYFGALPPPHVRYTELLLAGVFNSAGSLKGQLIVVSDLISLSVWQVAEFLLGEELRGTGAALRIHGELEAWAKESGAQWLRAAVTSGNLAAERFLAKCGYKQVRTKARINAAGETLNTLILVKALGVGTQSEYLALVPRDDPAFVPPPPGTV